MLILNSEFNCANFKINYLSSKYKIENNYHQKQIHNIYYSNVRCVQIRIESLTDLNHLKRNFDRTSE